MNMPDFSQRLLDQLDTGLFLTVGGEQPNTMTIGWGSLSVYWGKPVFIVPVRYSRYSFEKLKDCDEFTVSVPYADCEKMRRALGVCGRKSGRDTDKYALAGLELQAARQLDTPVIKNCECYLECKVIYTTDLDLDKLPQDIRKRCYPDGDKHRLYFGEIVACYKGDK